MAKTKTKDHTKYVFVNTNHDWADEFNMESAFVTTKEAFERDLAKIEARFKAGDYTIKADPKYQYSRDRSAEIYFGTNEFFSFYDFKDFMSGVTVKDCSAEFVNEFGKLVDGACIGFNVFDAYLNYDPNY